MILTWIVRNNSNLQPLQNVSVDVQLALLTWKSGVTNSSGICQIDIGATTGKRYIMTKTGFYTIDRDILNPAQLIFNVDLVPRPIVPPPEPVYTYQCPKCGQEFSGLNQAEVWTAFTAHLQTHEGIEPDIGPLIVFGLVAFIFALMFLGGKKK